MELLNYRTEIHNLFRGPSRLFRVSFILSVIIHILIFFIIWLALRSGNKNDQIILDSMKSGITHINEQFEVDMPFTDDTSMAVADEESESSESVKKKAAENASTRSSQISLSQTGAQAAENYQTNILRRIHRMKYYPASARRSGLEGEVTVRFTVKSDGTLHGDTQLVSGCNHDILNSAALTTISNANPFPEFTDDLKKERDFMSFKVLIDYKLNVAR